MEAQGLFALAAAIASAPGIGGCPAGTSICTALTFMVKAVASNIIIILLRNINPSLFLSHYNKISTTLLA